MTEIAAHEAGHAVVAYHYGLKVKSLGLDPAPHCLVSQKGATKEQVGVMLCAGAAATEMCYGKRLGHYWDFEMAKTIGCVEEFTAKAKKLIYDNWYEFGVIEQYMLGADHDQLNRYYGGDVVKFIMAAQPSLPTRIALGIMTRLQMGYPKLMGHLAHLQTKIAKVLTHWK